MSEYYAKFTHHPDTIIVQFPDVPEAITEGATMEEAMEEAQDALLVALLCRIDEGADIPDITSRKRPLMPVCLPAQVSAKIAVYKAWKEAGISKRELARHLGVKAPEVQRILDPKHATKLPTLEAALRVLGKRLEINVKAA